MMIMSLDIVIKPKNTKNIRNKTKMRLQVKKKLIFYCDLCRRYCEKVKLIKQKGGWNFCT